MLQVASALRGFVIEATDGALGTVSDFLFDDRTWKVRWLVVDTGRWLTGRKVLVHPSAVGKPDFEGRTLAVSLTKAQVQDSPDILRDRPVSLQMQNELYHYYGWDPLWGGSLFGGASTYGAGLYGGGMGGLGLPYGDRGQAGAGAMPNAEHGDILLDDGDPHLRSTVEVAGYHVHATDGNIGHVEDFLIEATTWGVRYIIVNTSNWWVGRHVLISPYAVKEVGLSERHILLDIAQDKVKSSPSWSPADAVDGAFERRLHSHYNWPGYGW